MAVVNRLSTLISNIDASPRVLNQSWQGGGNDTIEIGSVASVATDSIGSTYRFGFVPSGVRVQDVQLMTDGTTAGVWTLGVYNNDQTGSSVSVGGVVTKSAAGAVPIANAGSIFNAAGISTAAAQAGWASVYKPSILAAGFLANNTNLRVWELLGLDFDPLAVYHLVATSTTAPTSVGVIALQWSWVR